MNHRQHRYRFNSMLLLVSLMQGWFPIGFLLVSYWFPMLRGLCNTISIDYITYIVYVDSLCRKMPGSF